MLKKANFEQTCKKIGRKDRWMDEKTILYKNNFKEYMHTLALKTHFKAGCKNVAI